MAWARYHAYKWHRDTNHYYGKHPNEVPYEKHLEMVEAEAMRFLFLLPNDWNLKRLIIAACLVHDCIEDARVTYNDVKNALGEELANFAFALCNEKGKNRKARANSKYYAGIRELKYATFIKLCDRLANVRYSLSPSGGRMAGGYKKENAEFEKQLFTEEYSSMFVELRNLLS
ncbi:MAG: phosphohydrolase [Richelia sp. RM2_1_2]|nr:phosphohydrolase [Richelia sp. RM2_1_2]